jgi:hypothetical protein
MDNVQKDNNCINTLSSHNLDFHRQVCVYSEIQGRERAVVRSEYYENQKSFLWQQFNNTSTTKGGYCSGNILDFQSGCAEFESLSGYLVF